MSNEKMLITIGVVAALVLAVLGGVVIANNNSSNNNGVTDSSNSNVATDLSNNNNAASVPVVEQANASAAADNNSNSESAPAASEGAAVTEEIESDSTCVVETTACCPELTDEILIECMANDIMMGASTSCLIGQYTYSDGKPIESDEDVQCAMAMLAEDSGMTYEDYHAFVMVKVLEILEANGYDVMPIVSTTGTVSEHEHMFDDNGVCSVCGDCMSG